MRQRLQESLGETSGAVEIAVEQLDRFERGAELPSEDILMLLISHFNLPDDEALKLWGLAGYDSRTQPFATDSDAADNGQPLVAGDVAHHPIQVMVLALDSRILYTNGAEIVTDDNGVVLNFTQSDSNAQSPAAISRVGMSYSQAEQLLQTLQRALLHQKYLSGPKQLPPRAG
jgi:hypothetical protein